MLDDKEHPLRQVGVAVAIAGLSVLATKLVEWAVDEIRDRVSPKKPEKPKDPPTA